RHKEARTMNDMVSRWYGSKPAAAPVKTAPSPAPSHDAPYDMTIRQFVDLGETMLREALHEYDFGAHTRAQIDEAASAVIKTQGFIVADMAKPDGRARHRAMVAQSLGAKRRASYGGRG